MYYAETGDRGDQMAVVAGALEDPHHNRSSRSRTETIAALDAQTQAESMSRSTATELADLLGKHGPAAVTHLDKRSLVIDCACGAEVFCTGDEFRSAPIDNTSGALSYLLRHHVAEAIVATSVVVPKEKVQVRYLFCGHPGWPDPLWVWPATLENATRIYNENPHPNAWVGSRIHQEHLDVVIPKRSERDNDE